jgi:excisionase family DNA binding protein
MKKHVYGLIRSGKLPAVRLGEKSTRVRIADIEAYEAAHLSTAPDLEPAEVARIQQQVASWPELTKEQQAVIRSAFRA